MEHSDRDMLLAVVSGVAAGLLALSFPSPVALLGLIPGVVAVLDLLRRRQLTSVGVLLVAAALAAGLPSGWRLFGVVRSAGTALPTSAAAVFGFACGTLILGVMLLLLEPDEAAAAAAAAAPGLGPAGPSAGPATPPDLPPSGAPAPVRPGPLDDPLVASATATPPTDPPAA